jgi:hypothetical protein
VQDREFREELGLARKAKCDLYRLERFSPERLARLPHELASYAEAINGLPKHHGESLDKRGWLLPFLFTFDDLLWGRWSYWTNILMKEPSKVVGRFLKLNG